MQKTSKTGEFWKYSCIIFACSQRRKENIKDTALTTSKHVVSSIIYWWLLWGFPRKIRSLFPPDTSRTLATFLLRCLCVIPTLPLWPLIRSTLPQKQRSNLLWGPSLSPALQQTSGPPLLLHNFQSYSKGQRKACIKHPKFTLNHAGLSQPDMSTMRWREMKQRHRGMGLGPAPRELFVSRAPWEKDPGQTLEATARPDCGRVGVKIAAAEQISTEWGWQTAGLRWCEVERTQDMLAHTVDALCHHYQPQQQRQRWWKWESDYGCAEVLEWLRINNGSCREFRLLLRSRGFLAKGKNAQASMRNKFHLCERPETETHVCEVSRKRN